MNAIYEPKGRAGEYAQLAVNLWRGCPHGCTYPCYAPLALHMDRAAFHAAATPRKGILEALEKDAARLASDGRVVQLCFSCDPYPPEDGTEKLTRQALEILTGHDLAVSILTKGGLLPQRDFDLLAKNHRNRFGVTLTGLSPEHALRWEPNAPLPTQRLASLATAHRKGIRTWVSLEPVINPELTLDIIQRTFPFVAHFAVGKLNYHPLGQSINWPQFRTRVAEWLLRLGYRPLKDPHEAQVGRTFYLKRDLVEAS